MARVEMEVVATEAAQQMVEQLTGLKIDRKHAAEAVAAELEVLGGTIRGGQTPQPERELQLLAPRR